MKKGGSKYMKIKLEIATGNVVKVVDEKGKKAKKVTQTALQQIYQSKNGVKHVGTILHTHSSPGCITIILGGKAFQLCSFPKP
jgi:hypothetical protein